MTDITINGRFMTRPLSGVDRFATELLRAWLARFGQSRAVRAAIPTSSRVRTGGALGVRIEPVGVFSGHTWEQTELPAHCGDDLLLSLCNTGPVTKRRQLVVLHDVGVFANPATYSFAFRNWYRCLLGGLMRRAQMVASVSAFSASELMAHLGARARGVEIIHGAGEHVLSVAPDSRILERLRLAGRPYVLAVGNQTPNKNFSGIAKAGELLRDLKVPIVAVGGGNSRVFANARLDSSNVRMTGYVSDAELRALYENAQVFVFPSFYEGFGIPPLEAMHCGCPVVVSRKAALPEVCGEAALYCEPSDPADIAKQLRRVLTSASLRSELREAGRQRAHHFSWARSAEQLERLLFVESLGTRAGLKYPAVRRSAPGSAASATKPFVMHAAENIKGGVGTYLRDLLRMQRESFGAGSVVAVVPASQIGILGAPEGVELISFDDSSPKRLINALRLARKVQELMAMSAPDVVHLHSTFAGAALRPLLKFKRHSARVIYCSHGWAFDRQASQRSKLAAMCLERWLARLCDLIVCISEHEIRSADKCGIPASKLVLVRNGVPREAPCPALDPLSIEWPAGKRRVLFVGRFDRQKGFDVFLQAMSELRDEACAYVVGDAVLGDSRPLNTPANVRLAGWLSAAELEAYYRSADVLVVPSRWEGFGLIAAEAMRAGLPVVASRVGGLPEIVQNSVTGVLVPPDNQRALASALRQLQDSQLRQMGSAANERFLSRFTMERVHAQLSRLYKIDLSRAPNAAPARVRWVE